MEMNKEVFEMKKAVYKAESHHNLEHLAVGIVHEIRNPLTTIKGFLQLLKPYLKEVGKEHYADVILEEINRTNDIVFEFLNAAKREIKSVPVFTLNKVIMDMALLFESEAALKNVEIITSLTDQDISLNIPVHQFKQVIVNLMKNAIEAIDESQIRIIHISTQNDGNSASISISDSGCGMTEEMMNNLFIPFYSTKEKGTGVGLYVCKQIIEDYGGSLKVTSSLGEGTIFTITFPMYTN